MEKTREINQRLAGLLHRVQQSRLAMEADVKPDSKIRKRAEDAAADRMMSGDSSSSQVDPDPMCLASSSDDFTEPPVLPCRDDSLVNKGAEAPKPHLPAVEMRTFVATSGLLPAGIVSTATRTIFNHPSL